MSGADANVTKALSSMPWLQFAQNDYDDNEDVYA